MKLTDQNYLIDAIKTIGCTFFLARQGEIQLGDQKALTLTQQQDGTWQVSGDPWYDRGQLHQYYNHTDRLIADLQTHYNEVMVKDKLQSMGFYLEDSQETADEIVLTFENGM